MSRVVCNARSSGWRAIVVAGLFGHALQACNGGAPTDGKDQVTVRRGAATVSICSSDPTVPCLSSEDDRVLTNLKIVNIFMSSDWDSDNAGTDMTRDAINSFTQKLVTSSYFAAATTDYDGAATSVTFGGSFDATGLRGSARTATRATTMTSAAPRGVWAASAFRRSAPTIAPAVLLAARTATAGHRSV